MLRVCSWECKQLLNNKIHKVIESCSLHTLTNENAEKKRNATKLRNKREKGRKKVQLEAKSLVQHILDYWTSDSILKLSSCCNII